jgi:pyruvate kinase
MRNAKIICTIGPASDSEKMLTKLAEAGMDIARLNFSHGTHEDHLKKIKLIRRISKKLNKPIAILQDLQGPKIRIGKFAEPPISLNPGDLFTITTDERAIGNENIVSTSYKNLANDVEFNDNILVNDGLIKLKVLEKTDKDVFCEVINGGSLYDRRGINLPGVKISEPSLTVKDKKDLKFGLANGIDYVALSFVREADNIRDIKKFMGKNRVPVIAKLEKPEALNNLDEIIAETDGIMVARGDLGVEIFSAQVPVVQKEIIEKCIQAGKPVITATQMLDSMMTNPIPTRAETSDVANAVFDGSDAVMLSGETAFGKFPVESVKMMESIIDEAEKKPTYFRLKPVERCHKENHEFAHSICYAAYYAADETDAKYIVVFTRSGYTAAVMSALRPEVPILALTPSENTMRKLTLYWGVTPIVLDKMLDVEDDMIQLEVYLKKNNWVKPGDNIVVISGSSREAGGTNSLRLHAIG